VVALEIDLIDVHACPIFHMNLGMRRQAVVFACDLLPSVIDSAFDNLNGKSGWHIVARRDLNHVERVGVDINFARERDDGCSAYCSA
jgi:hypothetical protein